VRLLELATETGAWITVNEIEFTDESAFPDNFRGSPTVLIHGQDLDPAARGTRVDGFS